MAGRKTETTNSEVDVAALLKQIEELKSQVHEDDSEFIVIPDNAKIEIRSNITGKFILIENKGRINVYVALNKYGETTRISYEELRTLYGSTPRFFTSGKMAIVKVLSDNKKIKLQHVIEDMALDDIYLNKDKVSPLSIEKIFDDSVSDREFERLVSSSTEIAETILEVAYVLYRKGVFNNNSKMNYMRQLYRRPNLFR